MTETTDIKALRERMMQQREAALTGNTPSFEDCELLVCDSLRALTLSNKQIEAERQRADELKINWEAAKNSIQFYKAEIAALKGDQVPVAFTGSGSLAAIKGGHEGHIWGAPAEAHPVPLYDRPQKPVVLPKSFSQSDYLSHGLEFSDAYGLSYGSSEMRALCKKAIEAAGGIVKDGE